MSSERDLQDQVRIACSDIADLMRNNVGVAVSDGRRIAYGLGVGSADLIGLRRVDGRFVAIEVKLPKGRTSADQERYLQRIRSSGGLAGVARSVEDAIAIIKGESKW